jgi:hypothetical protein
VIRLGCGVVGGVNELKEPTRDWGSHSLDHGVQD